MEELKFRQAIFHPVTKEFLKWHYWGLIDKTFIGIDTGWVSPTKAVENSQRFTGLTDKNKIRIYEGDIVSLGERNDSANSFSNNIKECLAEVTFEYGHWNGKSNFKYTNPAQDLYWIRNEVEVTGNIWEHPNLLKDK